jgi:ribonucleoside-diphosphate reductase subunit M2
MNLDLISPKQNKENLFFEDIDDKITIPITYTGSINDIDKEKNIKKNDENDELIKISPPPFDIILTENPSRYVLFPIKDNAIWQLYKKQVQCFWTVEEVNLYGDLTDWNDKLNDNEKYFIKMILAFFSSSDGIVAENLALRFSNEVQLPEARSFYGFQNAMEMIHSEMYSLLIDTYVKDDKEKSRLFNAIENFPCIKQKAEWGKKWISDKKTTFGIRLIAFSIIEGVFFSGSFCGIYWIKKRGLMHGLTMSNELISRDEAMHTDFAVLLYSKINEKVPQKKVHKIMREAVEIESVFITEAIPCKLIGMNSELMKEYIKFVADRLLVQLGYEKIYNKSNPFSWMESISLNCKSNFFECTVTDYSLATQNNGNNELSFNNDVDF